ncbi:MULTISPECIES: DUF4190 domain-containing protein [unclassified Rothia (in: high G+C Gram-positive bacteria)]|uniref:DUF4190 domain-containing protein n=1 Tax=unclassified Rothia (in: high G+C Gram-positive bacteria) TaxID=2689056 RepID=UPI0024493BD4|nr:MULTISPECIES: DUF4190 domain-containing protein [unclassified Rothia (in: high G+C Gram-positive bacteria)]
MSENNYGNNQGNAQNPYAAQQPNSSAQSSYGQNYGQAPATQSTYGQDYGQSASAQNSYGQTQQNTTAQNAPQQNQYGQFGAQSSSQNAYGQNAAQGISAQGASAQGAAAQNPYGQAQPVQQQYGYGQDASYQAQPADYNYQQNSYQQQPQQDAYGYGQPAGYPYAAPVTKKAPGMALAAMILGIAAVLTGFLVFGALLGIAAIILGVLSLKKTKEVGAGKAFALTGIITGAVSVLISICMLFVAISLVQATQKCLEVGTEDGHGNVVCQIGDNPNNRMTVSAHR